MDVSAVKPARAARLLFQLPRQCRVFVKLQPSNEWSYNEVFANKTNYLLELLLWQNSYNPKKKGKHLANKPKPFIPEFMKEKKKPSAINNGSVKHTVDDIKSILALPRG